MKFFLVITSLLYFNFLFSQVEKTGNIDSYNLYIFYENTGKIFTKPIETGNEDFKYLVYSLRIPNQNNPKLLLNFNNKDSTELGFIYKGSYNHSYDFDFLYKSNKNDEFYVNNSRHLNNKITIGGLLNSNLEIFHEVLKKANKIYILEETEKEGYRYLVREVSFSTPIRL